MIESRIKYSTAWTNTNSGRLLFAVAMIACASISAQAEQIYERRMGDWSVICHAQEYGFQGCMAQTIYKAQDLAGRLRMGSDHMVLGIMMNDHTKLFDIRFTAPGWRYASGKVRDVSIVFDDAISWDIPMGTVNDGETASLIYSGFPDSEGALPGGFMSAQSFELIIDGRSLGGFPLTGSSAAISHASEKTEQFAGRTS